jgi:signal peptidase I
VLPQPHGPVGSPGPSEARVHFPDSDQRAAELLRRLRHAAMLSAEAVIVAALLMLFFVRVPQVSGHSMAPQIDAGDHVAIDTLAYALRIARPGGGVPLVDIALHGVARGDVIAFVHGTGDDRRIYLKRAIGLPGDAVAISRGIVSVDGRALDEPYDPQHDTSAMAAIRVPAGSLFVLGDNRGDSDDSRAFGPIRFADVVGRAMVVLWPPGRVKTIR